jgi:hypothetical protein
MTLRNSLALLCFAALFLAALTPIAPVLFWAILIPLYVAIELTVIFIRSSVDVSNPHKLFFRTLPTTRAP